MAHFLESEGIYDLTQLDRNTLSLYQEELTYRLTGKGKQLSARTREKYLCSVRGFTGYLYEQDYLASDPGQVIDKL